MGADEFYIHLYLTGENSPGGKIEIKIMGWPGSQPVYLFAGAALLEQGLPTKWGDWWNTWWLAGNITIIGPLNPIPFDGIEILGVNIPTSPPAPYAIPIQAFVGDSLTNLGFVEIE